MAGSEVFSGSTLEDVVRALDQSAQVSFVLDTNLRLTYCNQAWNRFALDNGAPELARDGAIGSDLRQVIGKELRPFYLSAFEKVAREKTVWECLYECSSPQLFRKFLMRIHLLSPSGWYLVTNSRVIERPHATAVVTGLEDYLNSDGLINMCMHCRCSRRRSAPEQWDFVPAHLDRGLSNVSHSLCPVCLEYFYPKPED